MGAVFIHVDSISAGNNHEIIYNCTATLDNASDGQAITYQCTTAYSALAATVNAALKDAAVAEALSQASYVVGALDTKILVGGAIGL